MVLSHLGRMWRFNLIQVVDEVLSGRVLAVEKIAAEVMRQLLSVLRLPQFGQSSTLLLFEPLVLQCGVEAARLEDCLPNQLFSE